MLETLNPRRGRSFAGLFFCESEAPAGLCLEAASLPVGLRDCSRCSSTLVSLSLSAAEGAVGLRGRSPCFCRWLVRGRTGAGSLELGQGFRVMSFDNVWLASAEL